MVVRVAVELLILDLDGTARHPDRPEPIRPRVVDAVANARRRGVSVSIATGRTFEFLRREAGVLLGDTPVVTSQGAVVADPSSGRILAEQRLPWPAALALVEWTARRGEVAAFYARGTDGRLAILQTHQTGSPEEYDHLFGAERVVLGGGLEAALRAGAAPVKVIVESREDADLIELRELLGATASVARTHPALLEATAPGVDKGSGVRALMDLLGVPRQAAMAVGDAENDLPMFREVGFSVAMGHAPAAVREAADWVAPTFEEGGLVAAIERFVLRS